MVVNIVLFTSSMHEKYPAKDLKSSKLVPTLLNLSEQKKTQSIRNIHQSR